MRKISLLIAIILIATFNGVNAQDSTAPAPNPLKISGSVDGYYRYNFANVINYTDDDDINYYSNNTTSFTNSQNAFQLGMASLKAEYTVGKVGAVADLGFGPRAEEFSYADGNTLFALKQAYIYYQVTPKFKLTAGKFGTHIGYELLDPQLNKNYSMSYMFSYGPFSHTGIKADFALGSGVGLMVGVANPIDVTAPGNAPIKTLLGQVSYVGSKVSAYLNYAGYFGAKQTLPDASNFSQIGLTVAATLSDKFSLGYDGTVQSMKVEDFDGEGNSKSISWFGSALYFNYAASNSLGLTLRAEYFGDEKYGIKSGVYAFYPTTEIEEDKGGANIIGLTLSAQYKVGNFTFIPELRMDNSSQKTFAKMKDNSPEATKSSVSALLAAIYSF